MKLREYLETAPDDRILYVGSCSGFLAVGYKDKPLEYGEDTYPSLVDQLQAESERRTIIHEEKRQERERQYARCLKEKGEDAEETRLLKANLLEPFIPFEDRQVLQTWERQEEDALNIQIEGEEHGKIWTIHEGDPVLVNENCEALVGAVFKEVVKGYSKQFGHELKELKGIIDKLKHYMNQSRGYENYIRYLCGSGSYLDEKGREYKFPNKLFATCNPEMILDLTRTAVVDTLLEQEAKEKRRREKKKEKEANEKP